MRSLVISVAFSVSLCMLGACSGMPRDQADTSACAKSEASYECQVERYNNVNE